jgi:hypothetical protein
MTLEVHGLRFSIHAGDGILASQVQSTLGAYGYKLSSGSAADAHGCFALETVDSLPSPPGGMREVGVDNNGVVIREGNGRFYLRTHGAAFLVDTAEHRVRGHVLASALDRMGAPMMWLTLWGLNLLLRGYGFFALHAAALTRGGGRGLIATGPSGSGKSTLACNLLQSGWDFLSDDTVLLHPEGDRVDVYSFRTNFSLREDSRAFFPNLLAHGQERPTGERKHWVPMRALFPEQAREVATPRALVFPEVAERARSRLVEIPPAAALHVLVGQSALVRFRRDWAEEHLAVLVRLTHQAPSYRLEAGRDLLDHPERSHELLAPLLAQEPALPS